MNEPTIQKVLNSPSTSYWLKNALDSALNRDVVDAAYDAQLLADLLKSRMNQTIRHQQ
jgi:hypothetical protein